MLLCMFIPLPFLSLNLWVMVDYNLERLPTPSAEGFKGETLLQGLCNRVATKGSNQ